MVTDAPDEPAFSPTDAALEGFRLARENQRLLLPWALVYGLATFAIVAAMVAFAGDTVTGMAEAEAAGNSDPNFMMQTLIELLPFSLLSMLLNSVFGAAVYRLVLAPEDRGTAFLRLGGAELRLFAVTLVFVLVWTVVLVAVVLAIILIAGLIGRPEALASPPSIFLITLLVSAWLLTRFSFAWPRAVLERRIGLLSAWRETRGHFWRLLGAYVLAFSLAVVVGLLGVLVYAGVAAIATGGDIVAVGQALRPDMSSLGAYFTLPMYIYMGVSSLLMPLLFLIVFAPVAIAYRAFTVGGRG